MQSMKSGKTVEVRDKCVEQYPFSVKIVDGGIGQAVANGVKNNPFGVVDKALPYGNNFE